MRAVALGLLRFGIREVSFQETSLLDLQKHLLMLLVLVCDVLEGLSLGPAIL